MPKKIVYFIAKKGMIKFEADTTKYTLSDELKNGEFSTNPLNAGEVVEVEVKDTVVVSLKRVVGEVKEEVQVEEKTPEVESKQASSLPAQTEKVAKPAVNEVVTKKTTQEDTKTVNFIEKEVVYASAYGVKFVGDDKWTNFSKELQAGDLKSKGLARKTIKATLEDGIVVAYEVLKEVEKETPKAEESKAAQATDKTVEKAVRGSNNSTNSSIEKQVSIKEAGAIVRSLIESGREEVNSVNKIQDVMKTLSQTCYDVLVELK